MTQHATDAQALTTADLFALPPTTDVETAARALGIGRTLAYQLVRTDKFPCEVIRTGRSYRVVTADLRRVLDLDASGAVKNSRRLGRLHALHRTANRRTAPSL
ncbi:helix-turn-helix domain-containing protein [Streptomyces sp. NWU339]|uniref:helix-turn-helix domain-containing protein n=1 Tax=Streptomyces sp. NWU339 TaxID=2185284 RepID=UPI001C62643E|nr:helix-turn-helix domain-containing protein [Streptomyces sp. NWU339]